MISVLSPSKDLDLKRPVIADSTQTPEFIKKSQDIIQVMKKKKVRDLMKLMNISEKLAEENFRRYQQMQPEFNASNARPALFTFNGDVYRGLDAASLNIPQLDYVENHCRILSGLYGILRPFDLIQPYRLEMGTSVSVSRKKNLYAFWSDQVTSVLNTSLNQQEHPCLINLASQEYFEVIDIKNIKFPVVHIHFRERRNGKISFLSYNAKRARGLMARYMAIHQVKALDQIRDFDLENYRYDAKLSSATEFYFVR
ncbi:MAG: peroxide stress protein YaaA [Saprospiraceae bacterium]|nr:peroxide stress protein YaaA [Saprospiraceae bacterium]HMW39567.1 peroxide stress protein YaaA [Saprospiraceae bacterium]HMX89300.1 peroxide stress protein YaaA [Saprospiraceae bacterium]HMZ41204.1 peroxide stress protein YaaA [Saprospiraceae bacterium]HNA64960.1 peroxide stress protein YaaA [Saprospiraceae bacterium]